MRVLAIKNDSNGMWFIHCGQCGKYLEKRFFTDAIKCECGWLWHGINVKDMDMKVALVTHEE